MNTTSLLRRLATGALALSLVAACSGDDDDTPVDDMPEVDDTTSDDGASTSDDGAVGGLEVPDDIPLDAVVSGLEAAMGDVDIEVDGSTLHVRIADGNTKVPPGTGCMIVGSVLPDGATAIVYQNGESTPCD